MDDKNQISGPSDQPIKLFGRSIAEPPPPRPSAGDGCVVGDADVEVGRGCGIESGLEDGSDDEGNLGEEMVRLEGADDHPQKGNQQDATSGTNENLETPVAQSKTTTLPSPRTEEDKSEDANAPQEKALKKPDKIIPCPRCASMDTKFCYFNNYNVNQPRYFCRKCQRYWTSGGTMRNLPVGSGRRKSKSSAVHYAQISVPKDFESVSAPHSNGVVALNGSVLSFVPDELAQQISSPEAVGKARRASCLNGSCEPKESKIPSMCEAAVVVDDYGSGSAGSSSNIENDGECETKAQAAHGYQSFQPPMLCFPAPLWPPFPWSPTHPLPSHVNFRPGFPVPFYPAPMYMGCAVPGAWNIPWAAHPSSPSPHSDPKSPTLGKHSRDGVDSAAKPGNIEDGEKQKEEKPKPFIWVPKTLRIDDLEEAAKSSMWATLGIKNDNNVCASATGKGHFRPFSSLAVQTDRSRAASPTSSALLANPAALSRSMNFRESS